MPVEEQAGHHAALGRRALGDDGIGPQLLDSIEHGIGDVAQGLVPGDALPLALAPLAGALQGVQDTLGGVEELAPGGALLAAHGVHVRHALLDGGEGARDLLQPDEAVLHVDPVGAVAGVAVHAVGAPGHLVPGPLLAVEVLPAAVGGRLLAGLELEVLEVEATQGGTKHRYPSLPPGGLLSACPVTTLTIGAGGQGYMTKRPYLTMQEPTIRKWGVLASHFGAFLHG